MSYNRNRGGEWGGHATGGAGPFGERRWGDNRGGGGSYQHHNGGYYQQDRKRGRDDDMMEGPAYRRRANERGDFNSPGRPRATPLSLSGAQARFKESVWKMGSEDYEAAVDLPHLAEVVQDQYFKDKELVFYTFRAAITEIPHKLAHDAALIAFLSKETVVARAPLADRIDAPMPMTGIPHAADDRPISGLPTRPTASPAKTVEGEAEAATGDVEMTGGAAKTDAEESKVNVGHEIARDFGKAVQAYLDERKWRNVRYCILLFAHLSRSPASSPVVSPSSVVALLNAFSAVLDEPGLQAARGDECVRIIVETLHHLGPAAQGTEQLRTDVQSYLAARRIDRGLFGDSDTTEQYEDPLETLVSSLSFESSAIPLPDVYSRLTTSTMRDSDADVDADDETSIELPTVLVPPEAELSFMSPAAASSSGLRGDEGVGYDGVRLQLKLFDDESVPLPDNPSGVVMRSLIHDIVNLYELNRKDAAAVLLDIPRWLAPGTFVSSKRSDNLDASESKWILENLIVETILTSLFAQPRPRYTLSYYHSVIAELCRLSPSTVAPALGKCVRRLYAGLGADGDSGLPMLDPEGIRRFAQWWSVHLSNFSFLWPWQDWAGDMDVSVKHPKRVFVKRTIELEVRLSYFDRVKGTIPPTMLDTGVMAEEAPSATYAYESEDHPHKAAASALLGLIRNKGTIGEVNEELVHFRDALQKEHNLDEAEAERIKLDMAVQTILQVGSRSFSHFLNVLERYLTLLRNLSPSASTRLELLQTVATFWRRNPQFHLIVLDKLLQYRLVDSVDVVSWVFSGGEAAKSWSDMDQWAALDITIKSVSIRIASAKARLEGLVREQEVENATAEHEIDLDKAMAEVDNEGIASARTSLESIQREFTDMVIEIVRQFALLLPSDVDKDDWETWWIEGWFREFCRSLIGVERTLTSASVIEGIDKLDLPKDSIVVSILDAAKEWASFA